MAFGKKKSPEEHAAEVAAKENKAFLNSPVGRARAAFERGDQVFQYEIDVMSQQAIIVSMVGSSTNKSTTDPVDVLNSVCREGWEIINGSFVFVEQGQQSRDKFMSSGQNVAIKGTTVGYYLFKRCDQNRRQGCSDPAAQFCGQPARAWSDGCLAAMRPVAGVTFDEAMLVKRLQRIRHQQCRSSPVAATKVSTGTV